MELPLESVSKAELGQLRAPSQADIERKLATAMRSPAQQQTHADKMAQLEKSAMRYVASKQQGQQVPQPQQTTVRTEPAKAPTRHNSVVQAGYDDKPAQNSRGQARTPEHVAIQRGIQGHIQRNMQREARKARFREVGQRLKATVSQMGQQLNRAARTVAPPTVNRSQVAQSELAAMQKMQSITKHREQAPEKQPEKAKGTEKGKEKAAVLEQAPVRQPQQHKGKDHDRGRDR